MNERFSGVRTDEDTKVLSRTETMFGPYEAIHERWQFEAIKAESIILISEDVSTVTNDELERALRTSELIQLGSTVTIARAGSGYTFINFNFLVS